MTRDEWTYLFDKCMVCGRKASEIHEIACGPSRQKALEEPAAWLWLCAECHRGKNGVHNYAVWPISRQLAIKRRADPEHYDRVRVNRLRGRADEAITEAEVDAAGENDGT